MCTYSYKHQTAVCPTGLPGLAKGPRKPPFLCAIPYASFSLDLLCLGKEAGEARARERSG